MSETRAPYGDPERESTDGDPAALADVARSYLALRDELGFEPTIAERMLADALARWDRWSALRPED